jgi:uncharacterized BrkB/YihY/UPF0761 family membrane protein
MKELKFFDRYQLIITIVGIAALMIGLTIFVPMFLTATIEYDEVKEMDVVVYNAVLQSLYSVFMFINFVCLVWFIVRALTFKMRKKEYDQES